jgi:sigma-B regulation protein RsbU (phosphoserine phosphatase)
MMTGIVKTAFHTAHADNFAPSAVISHLQSSLRVFEDCRFVTVFCARLDANQQQLWYTNSGHPPAIVRRRDGSAVLLEATGPLVCPALADLPQEQVSVPFGAGDRLFVYTDGLAEAAGPQEMFGHARIRNLVTGTRLGGPALLEYLLEELTRFIGDKSYDDDVTVLTLDEPG